MSETTEELEAKLTAYKDSYLQIEIALKADPENADFLRAKEELWEVIKLTEDVLKLRRKTEYAAQDISLPVETPRSAPEKEKASNRETSSASGDTLKVGSKCLAYFAGDAKWYPAEINDIKDGKYTITYTDYGDQTELTEAEVVPISKGGAKRPMGEREYVYSVGPDGEIIIPNSLKILPTDSEDVRNSKRRRIHAIKYSHRVKKLEEGTNTRQNAWQQFSSKVSEKKKIGFLTGRKKGSIFSSPDSVEGKVGVTGSGKPMAEQPLFKVRDVAREGKKINDIADLAKEKSSRDRKHR